MFEKFVGYGELKKDYLAIDFLKIVQECILLNFFTTSETISNLSQYALTKFTNEIEIEKKWMHQIMAASASNNDSNKGAAHFEDADTIDPSNLYEKKLNLVMIPHIMLWRCQMDPPNVLNVILETQLPFFVQACTYLIEC